MAELSRIAPRLTVAGEIHMRKSGNHKMAVELMDVSPTGCRMELNERVKTGEIIWVTLPGLQSIEARVAWSRDWIAGVEFVNPIHPAVFNQVTTQLQAGAR